MVIRLLHQEMAVEFSGAGVQGVKYVETLVLPPKLEKYIEEHGKRTANDCLGFRFTNRCFGFLDVRLSSSCCQSGRNLHNDPFFSRGPQNIDLRERTPIGRSQQPGKPLPKTQGRWWVLPYIPANP